MIALQNLEFTYPAGEFCLKIPDFHVATSEKVAVIGPSGSGKTTLLKLIAGIVTPRCGDISVDQLVVNRLNDRQRRDFRITQIGFVFQDFELIDYLNVLDNILYPYRISGALRLDKAVRARAAALAEAMGIASHLARPIDELSQGEKQRTTICRALLSNPALILADEATGNLDPSNKTRILDLLFDSVAVHQTTLLAVTHDHELLPRFQRVIDFQAFRQETAA